MYFAVQSRRRTQGILFCPLDTVLTCLHSGHSLCECDIINHLTITQVPNVYKFSKYHHFWIITHTQTFLCGWRITSSVHQGACQRTNTNLLNVTVSHKISSTWSHTQFTLKLYSLYHRHVTLCSTAPYCLHQYHTTQVINSLSHLQSVWIQSPSLEHWEWDGNTT